MLNKFFKADINCHVIKLLYMQTYVYINFKKGGKIKMEIIQLMAYYGADTLVTALCTVVFTGVFKIPIKKLAGKTKSSKKITRFVTFLPVIIGFGLTVLSTYLLTKQVSFSKDFYVQWLSSVSLSLAIYAFWEKFVPSEKKILTEAEIEANKAAVEELKSKLVELADVTKTATDTEYETACGQAVEHKKIIITNNKNLK